MAPPGLSFDVYDPLLSQINDTGHHMDCDRDCCIVKLAYMRPCTPQPIHILIGLYANEGELHMSSKGSGERRALMKPLVPR